MVPLPIEPLGEGPGKVAIRHLYLLNTDAAKVGLANSYHARLMPQGIDFKLLKKWLDTCLATHPNLESAKGANSRTLPASLRMIDVVEQKLVQAPKHCHYVALSYVWGRAGQTTLRCLKSNVHILRKEGGLLSHQTPLAEVVRSAIWFVAGLNVRYLWVDALCIMQDDDIDKMSQIALMDTIYAKAILTIVAACSASADQALCGFENDVRATSQITGQVPPGLTLIAPAPELRDLLKSSVWVSRAWTFQEDVLSHRRIYVAHEQIYFECSSTCRFCEYTEGTPDVTTAEYQQHADIKFPDYKASDIDILRTLEALGDFITGFSRRRLTYASDVHDSFAGILSVWQHRSGWSFRNGLPTNLLHYMLLWVPMTVITRRIARLAGGRTYSVFPSWSWMGWVGPVFFRAASAMNEQFFRNEVASFDLQDLVPPRRVTPTSSTQTLPVEGRDPADLKIDILTFASSCVTMTVSATQAVMLEPQKREDCEIYHCLYDRDRNHCGVAIGLDPGFFKDEPSIDLECILLSSAYEFDGKPIRGHVARRGRRITLTPEHLHDYFLSQTEAEYNWPERGADGEFDDTKFDNREWCAMNVMLVQRFGDDLCERVALGQIHIDAWDAARPVKREFRIA